MILTTIVIYLLLGWIAYQCILESNSASANTCNIKKLCLISTILGCPTLAMAIHYVNYSPWINLALMPMLFGHAMRYECEHKCVMSRIKERIRIWL